MYPLETISSQVTCYRNRFRIHHTHLTASLASYPMRCWSKLRTCNAALLEAAGINLGNVDGSGLNGMDEVDKESGVKVSMEVDACVLVSDMDTDHSDKNETESVRNVEESGVHEGDVGKKIEIDLGNATLEGERSRINIGDKGKGKVIEIVLLSSDSGPDNMDEEFVVANSSSRYRDPVDKDEELDVVWDRMRESFKDAARKNATRFAYFSHQEEEEDPDIDDDDDEPELPQTEANADLEDWPGSQEETMCHESSPIAARFMHDNHVPTCGRNTTVNIYRDCVIYWKFSIPREIDATSLERGLCEIDEVVAIHELHI
ncbi:Leucine-rich repeat, cysteine-containing subtype [Artemisia annua]|uniref:Leucine-rich repeat, cysteine-containing subtype n=1 Tax=Artemisia annua TaxID=35608 RepID=A0A2U1NYM0_ARTAN|nr:Leucine-rich repeat, cysteine-containing subtype [Artemisia annua]